MFEEVAFAPDAFGSAADLRTLDNTFGYTQGRLLALLPRHWEKEVLCWLKTMPDVEQARAKRYLERLIARAAVPSWFEYRHGKSWVENARMALVAHAVDQVVTKRGGVEGLTDFDSFFDALVPTHSASIDSTIEAYLGICRRLIERGPRTVLVDPYFKLWTAGCASLMQRFLKEAQRGRCTEFEIFFSARVAEKEIGIDRLPTVVKRVLGDSNTTGVHVRLVPVDDNGPNFHARLLLTAQGGLAFDNSFDLRPGRTVLVGTLAPAAHELEARKFLDGKHGLREMSEFDW